MSAGVAKLTAIRCEESANPGARPAKQNVRMPKILIVEDEGITALDIRNHLLDFGYAVTGIASSGEQAIAHAAKTPPDLVLMDIMLKGAMDGIQTAARLRERMDMPVIFLTAYGDEATVQRAASTAPYGYLLKPLRTGELRAMVEVALCKHQLERKLKQSEQWLAKTLHSIGDAVITTDARGQINFVNPAAETLTGWRHSEAKGVNVADVFRIVDEKTRLPVANTVVIALSQAAAAGPRGPILLLRRTGAETPIDEVATPIVDDRGALIGAVLVFRDVTERRRAEEKIAYLAHYDTLTGLGNRALLDERISQMLADARRHGKNVGVMYLDLDGFKFVNDSMGHAMGDALLQNVAQRLRECVRETDTVIRLGGDEFMLLLADLESARDAETVARKVVGSFARPFAIEERELFVTLSVGVAVYPDDSTDKETLIKNADIAMYRAKDLGKNNYQIYSSGMAAQSRKKRS